MQLWRKQAVEAGRTIPVGIAERTDWNQIREQAGHKFFYLAEEMVDILRGNLEQYRNRPLKPGDFQHLSISTGIATDKAIDLLVGRKGMEVTVDNRQQSVLSGFSADELRGIIAAFEPRSDAVEAAPATPSNTETLEPHHDVPSLYSTEAEG